MLDGRDLADVPIEIAAGQQVAGVVLTFTDRATELSGTLLDANGQAAPGYYVVVFSTDAAFWSPGSRRTPAPFRAATDGRYRFSGLPPGSYHVAAITSVDQIDLTRPDHVFVEALDEPGAVGHDHSPQMVCRPAEPSSQLLATGTTCG